MREYFTVRVNDRASRLVGLPDFYRLFYGIRKVGRNPIVPRFAVSPLRIVTLHD